ncbi:protein-methionine-sulfoxide reductase heme-binding subunit MsrQ [Rehaibacterium terrae]|uniref:Protein-methionine-sulfoxide reductase heme-binding subunit MsrQ n=1 Tax=Rehaibacterium terrae TaxID=1341696 RepID=A0A7W7XYR4_9GAMM|nr:sulfoxide reductase heme-binding subunit YedZ [Rehaibacterium terrae]
MVLSAGRLALARLAAHALAALPLAWLAWLIASDGLGADPVVAITRFSGLWALRFLLASLAITPLRHLTGLPALIHFRRMLGLWAFAWASLHLSAYVVLDLGGYWTQILEDIVERPYITVGFLAWLGLLPLALTSTRAMMRRLGRHWGRLHKLVYAIAVLAVLHFWWLVKADLREPSFYAVALALLLGIRLARGRAQPRLQPVARGP